MASVSVTEEVSHALLSGDNSLLTQLFDDISSSVLSCHFLKEGDHFFLLNEGKQGFSRCFDAEWCVPKHLSGSFVALRLVMI